MKRMYTMVAGGVLLAGAAMSVAQSATERERLERRLGELQSEAARVESRLGALDEVGPEQGIDVPPELRDRFERIRKENPERAERWRERHRGRLAELRELREKDPEAYRARIETMQALRRSSELAAEVAQLEDAGKTDDAQRVREELRAEAEFIFERMLERRRKEIETIEGRLAEARERLEEMESEGARVLDERIEQAIERARERLDTGRERQRRR